MTAMMVTPEIVRVFFLRRRGRRVCFSLGWSAAMMSAFDGVCLRWCLVAVSSFRRCMSCGVGLGSFCSVVMISLSGVFLFNRGDRVRSFVFGCR